MPAVVVAASIAGSAVVAGGAIAAGGAKKAARTQSTAAKENAKNLRSAGDSAAKDLAPWEAAGIPALKQYSAMLGLGGEAAALPPGVKSPDEIRSGFQADPGYEFMRAENLRAIEQSGAVKGQGISGQTLAGLQQYSSGLASQEYGNYYNREINQYNQYMGRLAGLSDMGYNAAVAGANVKVGAAGQAAQSNSQAAGAIAQGQLGAANAWGGALAGLGQAAGTAIGYYGNQPSTQQQFTPPSTGYTAPITPYTTGADLKLGW